LHKLVGEIKAGGACQGQHSSSGSYFDLLSMKKKNKSVANLISSVNSDVEELNFSDVLSAASEQSESSEKDVGVGHEPDGLDGVAGIAPPASVRIESTKKKQKRFQW